MAIKNQQLVISFLAWETDGNNPLIGESANMTLQLIKDGGSLTNCTNSPSEISATGFPGAYKITLSAAEMNADFIGLGGSISTSGVIYPTFITTESNYLVYNSGKIDTLDTAQIALSGHINTISGYVDTMETDLTTEINANETKIDNTINYITTISGNIDTIDTNLDTLITNFYTVSGQLYTASGNLTNLTNYMDTVSGNLTTVDTNLDTLIANFYTVSGQIYTTSGIVRDIYDNLATTSGVLATVSGKVTWIKQRTDYLPSGTIDGVSHSGALTNLLAMSNGKFIRTDDNYVFYRQDNSTPIFTLAINDTTRTRS